MDDRYHCLNMVPKPIGTSPEGYVWWCPIDGAWTTDKRRKNNEPWVESSLKSLRTSTVTNFVQEVIPIGHDNPSCHKCGAIMCPYYTCQSCGASSQPIPVKDPWLVEDSIKHILTYIKEDPERQGLEETPKRFKKALREWFSGYNVQDPSSLLKSFEDGAEGLKYDEMVIQKNIPVYSHCEHHLAPIFGVCHIGYVPDSRIVGLSKLARVVDAFACRLQVQERLTQQIADCILQSLQPKGIGVIVEARHFCMESRGVKVPAGTLTTTSALRGVFLTNPTARSEFMNLVTAK